MRTIRWPIVNSLCALQECDALMCPLCQRLWEDTYSNVPSSKRPCFYFKLHLCIREFLREFLLYNLQIKHWLYQAWFVSTYGTRQKRFHVWDLRNSILIVFINHNTTWCTWNTSLNAIWSRYEELKLLIESYFQRECYFQSSFMNRKVRQIQREKFIIVGQHCNTDCYCNNDSLLHDVNINVRMQ